MQALKKHFTTSILSLNVIQYKKVLFNLFVILNSDYIYSINIHVRISKYPIDKFEFFII